MAIEHRRDGDVAIVTLACPPVNALGLGLRHALHAFFDAFRADAAVRAAIIVGSGGGFCAGGDRTEFGTPHATARPTLSRDVLQSIEDCGKPVVAAVHGFAIGGGLELALACSLRAGVSGSKVGLPEVGIGRFPLSGSQRLPRLVGVDLAAEWMMRAQTFAIGQPETVQLFDRRVDTFEELLPAALQLARATLTTTPTRVRDRTFPDPDPRAALDVVESRYPAAVRSPAQRALLAALHGAVEARDFQEGLDRAQVLFDELVSAGEQR